MFTVTRQEKDGSVGRKTVVLFYFFFLAWTTQLHIMTLNMRRPHTFRVYIGLRNLKLLLTCEIFAFYQFLGCFVNIYWKIRGKNLQSGVLGRIGRVTVNTNMLLFFSLNSDKKKKKKRVSYIFMKNPLWYFKALACIVCIKKCDKWTDGHGQAETNMPPQLRSWGYNYVYCIN